MQVGQDFVGDAQLECPALHTRRHYGRSWPEVRRNVYKLPGGDWDPTILWYARAIADMQTRPINNPTSWRYQAAIHDYTRNADPNAKSSDRLPSATDQRTFWAQCQHGSWYFLPWHRIYLAYFEQVVAATVQRLGGPPIGRCRTGNSDTANPNARKLPPAFRALTLPNGKPNPLRIAARLRGNSGNDVATATGVSVDCLRDQWFAAQGTGGDPGLGAGDGLPPQHRPGGMSRTRPTERFTWRSAGSWAPSTPPDWIHLLAPPLQPRPAVGGVATAQCPAPEPRDANG